ncbi:MAG TPA: NAD(P)/FAD-dependent oxidoreductase [Candidatus Angelobacter sp.]|jgi:predicted Rossmann fold flavoprotein|nr:NAD(P)/FAD-dependent oxidoreductase [Candidatus Angelobacter sp.]
MKLQFDVIILGAGAAGLMCAIEAGKRGRRVAVLERAERVGKKILISGGGRCNFTNLHCRPENFISANPHFAKSALARYTPADFIALVEKHGIAYHEKTLGQLFCDGSAQQIVAILEAECRAAGVRIQTNVNVEQVSREDGFLLRAGDDEFHAQSVVVATGGLSIPKMGATAFGYDLARQFGLNIVQPRPALVPFTLNKDDAAQLCDLAGLSAEVVASIGAQSFREKMLITHRGLSGPAILQISSYWKPAETITLDLAPERELTTALRDPKARRDLPSAKAAFRMVLPNRFAERWLDLHPPQGWSNHALDELEHRAHNWQIIPEGTEGYAKAEVTAGGIDTNELSAKTMESRKVPGLYFIGEVVDVTGHLGGFNFQWAWASGFSAGLAA